MFKKFRVYILFSAAFALVGLLISRYRQQQPAPSEQMEILVPEEPRPEVIKAAAPATITDKTPSKSQPPDDLTRITGIGPKISSVLNEAGVTTFEQLAALTPQDIRAILDEAGVRLGKVDTWPEQAADLNNIE